MGPLHTYCVHDIASGVSDSVIPCTTPCQAPLSVGFSRQEHWSGLPFPPPGHLPDPGIECPSLYLLHWRWQAGSFSLGLPGEPWRQRGPRLDGCLGGLPEASLPLHSVLSATPGFQAQHLCLLARRQWAAEGPCLAPVSSLCKGGGGRCPSLPALLGQTGRLL